MTLPLSATTAGAVAATTAGNGPVSSVRQAAEGFEGIFMSVLVEEMMKGTEAAGANPAYAGLMTEKLGDQLARSGGIGLADLLERQLGGGAPAPVAGGGPS
ncbi:rod-binding protein [Miltoncostaea marina]|uniref:rod-binding protein n=1 Tax=Miltoncostaea marina TaxID=2843215 RepID=UPI001C3CB9C1|nr:rod-binding protein [Miltoncostaea marina]